MGSVQHTGKQVKQDGGFSYLNFTSAKKHKEREVRKEVPTNMNKTVTYSFGAKERFFLFEEQRKLWEQVPI